MHFNLSTVLAIAATAAQLAIANPVPEPMHRDNMPVRIMDNERDSDGLLAPPSKEWRHGGGDMVASHAGGEFVRVIRRGLPSSWLECEQRWFGTAPFCNGECPPLWTADQRSSTADGCFDSTPTRIRTGCFGLSSNHCTFGTKVLCEGNCVVGFGDGRPKVKLTIAPPPRG